MRAVPATGPWPDGTIPAMTKTLDARRIQRTIEAVRGISVSAADGEDLFDEVALRLKDVVPYDGALWFGADPSTCLATFPVRLENIEAGHCESYWQREFLVEDALLFRDVARAARPVGTLSEATGGLPGRSARYREFLAPQGYEGELRAAFRADRASWGFMSLMRDRGRPEFSATEQAVVDRISGLVADGLRSAAVLASRPAGRQPEGPGLVMFDEHGVLQSLNEEARGWIDELPPTPLSRDGGLPSNLLSAVSRARAIAEGRDAGQARLRLRSRSGRWLVVHASCLRQGDGRIGQTALVIEPARAGEIAPLIVTAYELSGREQEIVQLIARGVSTNDIASTLFLSPHTVRDHVKAIFEKVGVSSRGELVAKVFAEHYAQDLHHRVAA